MDETKMHFISRKFSRKSHETFREKSIKFAIRVETKISFSHFTKIDTNSRIIIDVEYLGNGASDWILFTKIGILK
jgi:hypothetical protein